MIEFWKEHSQHATVEEMMLDSNAQQLTKHELPEILEILPSLDGIKVLELGAGIGRYTKHLMGKARHVTAVDFMEKFLKKNKEENSHLGNAEFIQADVTQLEFPENSFDLIFSNWLLMYLSDEELCSLTEKMLSWLHPNGYLFFRESCFHQSGDSKRDFNPTHYRSPAQYNHLITSVIWSESAEKGKQSYGFDTVLSRNVQTYIKMKKNQNQVCWLMQKTCRDSVQQHQLGFNTFQQFLDNQQYSRRGILKYEKMFGSGYVSTGGPITTKEFVDLMNLSSGQKVLDVGSGIGGGDFYMAKTFGVEVLGIDLSSNMVEIAMERAVTENLPSSWLKPGGKVLITDYCCGEKPWTPAFQTYVNQRGYILYTPQRYGKILEAAGFTNVGAEDRTAQFISVIKAELKRAEEIKKEFIQEFSQEDFDGIVNGWTEKLQRCEAGDQRWGLFYATKD
ncbi:Phosphoethanolamine N-methyltransferase 3 [Bagarius yarrelli]|uniref:phosphoethanolamine N-methyltransferase n=1 Tax=Bagarius yarrelli TaxID=175774 RepID=A0A556TRL4_BAGYA|nr:Phosphoethanolamine N-methyltransferase 3 [Bagarius yarrelli]